MANPTPWEELADSVLQRHALRVRAADGVPVRDFPGVYVDHADVDRILGRLPGLNGPQADPEQLLASIEPTTADVRARFHKSLSAKSVFADVVRSAGLAGEEAEILALLCAIEVDPSRQRLVVYIQDSMSLPRLTLATVARLFPDPHLALDSLAPSGPLRRTGLVGGAAAGSWANRQVWAEDRLVWALKGNTDADPGLPAGAMLVAAGRETAEPQGQRVAVVAGADRVSRLEAGLGAVGAHEGLLSPIPADAPQWSAVVREATILRLPVVLEVEGALPPEASSRIAEVTNLRWIVSSPDEIPIETLPAVAWADIDVGEGIAAEADWVSSFGTTSDGRRLTREQLELAARVAQGSGADVNRAVRRLASGHLDSLALRIRPRRNWSHLVMPVDQQAQLRELTARFHHRKRVYEDWEFRAIPSSGIVALFSGPSGTGKTLAAEVIAAEIGLDVYKVDLASVVSKYIGETEKNLSSVFNAAAAGEVVLFFDEADALFGKRSEVSDAHDRFANIETSYLLQRIESYNGLVILATNLQRNMDQAFLRRIHAAIEFPMPDEPRRRAIWEISFPAAAPTVDIDLAFLARQFELSGGSIRNVALGSAFLAASAGKPISMNHVILGLKREYQKLGRLRTEVEFDRYFDLVRGDDPATPVG